MFIYGISVGWKNSGTFFYIIWFFLGAFCFLIEIMTKHQIWTLIPSFMLVSVGTMVLFGILLCLFILGLIFSKFNCKGIDHAEYIIVLGAQWKEKGPSKALKYRLDCAKEYLDNNKSTICIVSGGQGYNEPCSEAEGMATYLIEKGIEESRIIKEDKSTSTLENIRFSMKYINNYSSSVCIVTNAFHVYRGCGIAKKQGLKNVYGLSAKSDRWYLANNTLREVFGIIKDTLVKNM